VAAEDTVRHNASHYGALGQVLYPGPLVPAKSLLTAVCTVIEPSLPSVMLLTKKTTWTSAGVPLVLQFNRTANRCEFPRTHLTGNRVNKGTSVCVVSRMLAISVCIVGP